MENLDEKFWQSIYDSGETRWDVGSISVPLKNYIDQLTNKDLKILIPGGGNSYETEYIFGKGFRNVTLLDITTQPLENFKKRVPDFPPHQLVHENFFDHQGQYDLIIEQTFFCAVDPSLRTSYSNKMHDLLKSGGRLVGLLFDDPMIDRTPPPFGGTRKEYLEYFSPLFQFKVFERAYNSIAPRKDRELFMILLKKEKAEPESDSAS
jgi:SAM-dependent methyltransferase